MRIKFDRFVAPSQKYRLLYPMKQRFGITFWEIQTQRFLRIKNMKSAPLGVSLRRYLYSSSLIFSLSFGFCAPGYAQKPTLPSVSENANKGAFPISKSPLSAPIIVSDDDFQVTKIAAQCLADDLEKVTGFKSSVSNSAAAKPPAAIFIGTLGKSPIIDGLVADKKLDVSRVRGQWEAFTIATVQNPVPGVKQGLVLAGNDRRGTAYAAFTLSQSIGVSPWVWWADVKPAHKNALWLKAGTFVQASPAVKYRGIFINDEDFGLQPWAAKTFEPETKDIGPKTYAKVCELLLRLKANYLWPAMHPSTKAFNSFPQNKVVADQYAIVMGASHAEPMLRNNVGEWSEKTMGPWDYTQNRDKILAYWEQRVKENGPYENLYTIGMRGVHDSAMKGGGTTADQVARLEQIFADQRALFAKYVNPHAEKVPQIFVPYKEVLTLYQNGLKVPDDVTLVWVDDNHGYIRQLPNATEQKRSGGSGVYYHLSYWGAPEDYLWLCTTPPALMRQEMTKAYDYDARNVWVVNVGDIKPQEVGLDLFLNLAWDVNRQRNLSQREVLAEWATRTLEAQNAPEIAAILDEYYRLNSVVRPEHLNINRSGFSFSDFGDEALSRLDQFAALVARANSLYARTPSDQKDALYQLVVYPVRCAALMNEKVLNAERSRLYATQGRASTLVYADKANAAFAQIQAETAYYNTDLAGGKWSHMMSYKPRDLKVFGMPAVGQITPTETAGLGVAVEGEANAVPEGGKATMLNFNSWSRRQQFVDVFDTGKAPLVWKAVASDPWIQLSQTGGNTSLESRLLVSVDWNTAPREERGRGTITISGAGSTRTIAVPTYRPPVSGANSFHGSVQNAGAVSVEAEDFTRMAAGNGAAWKKVAGLGRDSDAMTIVPVTSPSVDPASEEALKKAPCLQYDVQFFTPGSAIASIYCSPTQRINDGRGVRYAIAINDEKPQIVNLQAGEYSGTWSHNILQNSAIGTTTHTVTKSGLQTIKIWMVDPGVVLDKVVLSVGSPRASFLGPPETPNKAANPK
ncbi:hypothetical protein IAD21_06271 [Abditibacteriota bacterium]|nr:hypothetical protein IAD21_06271 [Abditibacteriota bacterium]